MPTDCAQLCQIEPIKRVLNFLEPTRQGEIYRLWHRGSWVQIPSLTPSVLLNPLTNKLQFVRLASFIRDTNAAYIGSPVRTIPIPKTACIGEETMALSVIPKAAATKSTCIQG
jgi:hypothetical protein